MRKVNWLGLPGRAPTFGRGSSSSCMLLLRLLRLQSSRGAAWITIKTNLNNNNNDHNNEIAPESRPTLEARRLSDGRFVGRPLLLRQPQPQPQSCTNCNNNNDDEVYYRQRRRPTARNSKRTLSHLLIAQRRTWPVVAIQSRDIANGLRVEPSRFNRAQSLEL